MASEDQYLPGHFDGSEVIEVEGMHKDMPRISSHLPRYRVRAFVTRRDKKEPEDLSKASFDEVGLKPETLWLFPEILRGVILWRGMVTCSDDEYSDLGRLLVADEANASEPKPIEHYRDIQLKKADLSVPFDPAMQLNFQRKMAAGAKQVLNLPKKLKETQARALGQAPGMVMKPADVGRSLKANLAQIRGTIDSVEATAKRLHERSGHMVDIKLDTFPRARAQADKMEGKLNAMLQRAQAMEQRKAELLDKARTAREGAEAHRLNCRPKELPSLDLSAYVGTYVNEALGNCEVTRGNGGLRLLTGPARMATVLRPCGRDSFEMILGMPGPGPLVQFLLGPDGRAKALRLEIFEVEGVDLLQCVQPQNK